MDLVLCHTTADFDTLGAAVGVACLRSGTKIVLAGGAHPTVQSFLAIWKDEYPLIDRRAVAFEQVKSLTLVDAHQRDRFTPVIDWIEQAERTGLPIYIYDHHSLQIDEVISPEEGSANSPDIPSAQTTIEPVGAVTTLIVERLQLANIIPTPFEATVMALGIHSDSGSLTFESATARDALALGWLMSQGANQQAIAENSGPALSAELQDLLSVALDSLETEEVRGHQLGWVSLETEHFIPGLSGLAERLIELVDVDTLLLFASYQAREVKKAVVIGRSRTNPIAPNSRVDLRPIFSKLGGGGHAQAASAVLGDSQNLAELRGAFADILNEVRSQIPAQVLARSLMSSPVRTILPNTSVDEAQAILLRYGHAGLCVVDAAGELVGVVSRRDIDIARRYRLGHSPVKGCMSTQIKSIEPTTPIADIQELMTTYDIGRLPVLEAGKLIGIVTRTDLLRQLQQGQQSSQRLARSAGLGQPTGQLGSARPPDAAMLYQTLRDRISEIWPALMLIAEVAEQRGWALYLVGGAVRDLLLGLVPNATGKPQALTDIDLVVDGAGKGAGVALAEALQAKYPQVSVQIYGQFQTAALVWHSEASPAISTNSQTSTESQNAADDLSLEDSQLARRDRLLIDIVTARTEFYPYPAANPEVEASSIRQDLYRRDFTINAMAIALNETLDGSPAGSLLDAFGGWIDLQERHVRVLHANSFIEDPTRIFRAVRFAVRLGFSLEAQTERFIRTATSSGVYAQMQASLDKTPALQARLKTELTYMLSGNRWEDSLRQIDDLGALVCIHRDLRMTPAVWQQLRRLDRWLSRFGSELKLESPRWLLLLELTIAQMPADIALQAAAHLDLSDRSRHRLENLQGWETQLISQFSQPQPPSQVYWLLKDYKLCELLLMSDRHPRLLGPAIWQYVLRLSQIQPLLNGNDLKRLGLKPGPQFREVLEVLYRLTLDGKLTTFQSAEDYVLAHYV